MATRALQDLKNSLIKTYPIKSGVTLVAGNRVKFGASDTECDLSGANDDTAFGTVLTGGVGVAAATVTAQIVLDGLQVVPMKVGTGGTTRGVKQVMVSDGITDAPTNGAGTTAHSTVGIALQSGVVGDIIGVMPTNGRFVAAT